MSADVCAPVVEEGEEEGPEEAKLVVDVPPEDIG